MLHPVNPQGGFMRSAIIFVFAIALVLAACAQYPRPSSAALSGERAMEYVRDQVAFGPRPPGSPQLQKCRAFIEQQLRGFGYQIEEDAFIAQTPYGPIKMDNLIARQGSGDRGVIALASHYDTKLMEGKNFVGANDGGSSTGLLMELARVLAGSKGPFDYWFLFLDGEEAFVEWSTFDSTYGSRHLAQRWKQEGVVPKIRALILLDMIGDKDLDIWYETNSTPRLMDLVWDTAADIGLQSILSQTRAPVGDDHIPFLDVGIPSVDIIDLNYGPRNSYHHTVQDTLDKISPQSMEKVGRLVLAMLPALQKQN
jgi:glutaminyl-peptide cyclotransferase